MHAYICKTKTLPEATQPLKIHNAEIGFLIDAVKRHADFQCTGNSLEWVLKFFGSSPFEQTLVVHLRAQPDFTAPVLGKAIWLNNSDNASNNLNLRSAASQFLRHSDTLPPEKITELTTDRGLITDRDGFAYLSKDPDQFFRIVLCQALAIAYTEVLANCIEKLTAHVKENANDKTLLLYEDILKFNAADYFTLPVRLDRHEVFSAWNALSKHYHLSLLSQELTGQLTDVAHLLRNKSDREREKQAALAKAEQQLREEKLSRRFTQLSLLVAALSLFSLVQVTPQHFRDAYGNWIVPLLGVSITQNK